MQHLSCDFVDVNFVKFKYNAGIEDRIYIRFATLWPSVNEQIISAKTHEMTRCKQPHS